VARHRVPRAAFRAGTASSIAISAVTVTGNYVTWLPPGPSVPAAELAGLTLLGVAAVRRARAQHVWRLALVAGVAGLLVLRRDGRWNDGAITEIALYLLAWAVLVAVAVSLRAGADRRRAGTAATRTHERMDLARELHDVVAHDVTGIILHAQAAQRTAADDPARLVAALALIEEAGQEALGSMRRVVSVLRAGEDAPRGPEPGPDDLAALAERLRATGVEVVLRLPGAAAPLPPGFGSAVHRVAGEAVVNARRHAPGLSRVEIVLEQDPMLLQLFVRNDGVPALRPAGAGFGIIGMTERVAALGGTLSAGPDEPGGWLVRADLPLPVL
jgi:signal transduction histidine kinase